MTTDSQTPEPVRHPVSIAACRTYDPAEVRRALARLIEPLGGFERFVPRGKRVVLKPNFLLVGSDRRPISTHAELIRAVFEAVRAAGGDPVVFDVPGLGSVDSFCRKIGLADLPVWTDPPRIRFKSPLGAFGEVERVHFPDSVVINLAKFKTHGMMVLTLAIKNMFGLVSSGQRIEWHMKSGVNYDHFASFLVALERHVHPELNLIDAVVAMEGNGPAAGTARPLGCLLACDDAPTLDVIACRMVGMEPLDLAVLAAAKRMGVLTDLNPPILGDGLAPFQVRDFELAADLRGDPGRAFGAPGPRFLHELIRRWTINSPAVDPALCTGCRRCGEVCPAKVIDFPAKPPRFGLDRCIRCFCCQEMCPEGAIRIKRGLFSRLAWRRS